MLMLSIASLVHAEPFIPDDDGAVLERVPAARETQQLQPLRRKVASDPSDLQSVLQLTEGYLRIGRETADPRFTSYAQATIEPWLRRSDPPAPVLVLGATVLQSSHRFEEALQLLDRALIVDQRNAQAWLTKATILQVQGRFAEARGACNELLRTAGQVIAVSCITGVNSLNGRLEQSYRSLLGVQTVASRSSPELSGWLLGQLGEMAVRLGDHASAEQHFIAALDALPDDVYLKAAYADLLLGQHRVEEVRTLLAGNEQQDVLLLRLAIAGKRLGTPTGKGWATAFEARFDAARRAGDTSHLREYARFLLEVRGDAARALEMAKLNWQVQREPADVRVYVEAARALGPNGSDAEVTAWIEETGFEDRTLAATSAEAGT